MSSYKNSIKVHIDDSFLLEMRKVLFANGLTMNEFFNFIAELTFVGDEKIDLIIDSLREQKSHKLLKGGLSSKNINIDNIYDAIEERLKEISNDKE